MSTKRRPRDFKLASLAHVAVLRAIRFRHATHDGARCSLPTFVKPNTAHLRDACVRRTPPIARVPIPSRVSPPSRVLRTATRLETSCIKSTSMKSSLDSSEHAQYTQTLHESHGAPHCGFHDSSHFVLRKPLDHIGRVFSLITLERTTRGWTTESLPSAPSACFRTTTVDQYSLLQRLQASHGGRGRSRRQIVMVFAGHMPRGLTMDLTPITPRYSAHHEPKVHCLEGPAERARSAQRRAHLPHYPRLRGHGSSSTLISVNLGSPSIDYVNLAYRASRTSVGPTYAVHCPRSLLLVPSLSLSLLPSYHPHPPCSPSAIHVPRISRARLAPSLPNHLQMQSLRLPQCPTFTRPPFRHPRYRQARARGFNYPRACRGTATKMGYAE